MLVPSEVYRRGFRTQNVDGVPQNADALPVVTLYKEGVLSSEVITVTAEGTVPGMYFFSFTVPDTWVAGELVSARLVTVIDSTTVESFVDLGDVSTVQPEVTAITERLAAQVPNGPVVVNPSPPTDDTVTVAYGYTLNEAGVKTVGIRVKIKLISISDYSPKYLYSGQTVEGISGGGGLVQINIPRGTGLTFEVFCGYSQRGTRFSGGDVETLELPALLEKLPGSNC